MIPSTNSHNLSLIFSFMIIGWIIALLIESSQPPLPLFGEIHGLDKLAHFFAFNILGLLTCCLSFHTSHRQQIPLFSMPLLIASLFGVTEESYQMLIPGRASDLMDLLADVCGALFAIILANAIARIYRVNRPISQA